MFEEYIKTIRCEAKRYPRAEFDDLVQEGRLAVWKAIKGHNPNKSQLETFIINHIKWAMLHYMRDKASTVRIPRGAYEGADGVKSLNYCEIEEGDLTYINEDSYIDLAKIKDLLSERDFIILHKYYFEDLSQSIIAKQFNVHQNTISVRLRKILQLIKETIE